MSPEASSSSPLRLNSNSTIPPFVDLILISSLLVSTIVPPGTNFKASSGLAFAKADKLAIVNTAVNKNFISSPCLSATLYQTNITKIFLQNYKLVMIESMYFPHFLENLPLFSTYGPLHKQLLDLV